MADSKADQKISRKTSHPSFAPHGREQELKPATTTTGAGEVSVPHTRAEKGSDYDYGSEGGDNAFDDVDRQG